MDSDTILELAGKVTKKWTRQKERERRRSALRFTRDEFMCAPRQESIKSVVYRVMPKAYAQASGNGRYPAHARQVMYCVRRLIGGLTDKSLNDQYFTQQLLPSYMDDHPEETAGWKLHYDARGNLIEPHSLFTRQSPIPLGTEDVEAYICGCKSGQQRVVNYTLEHDYRTRGPINRYNAILFCEKEGFNPLFESASLAERWDIAIMSTKGMSNIASRRLIDCICGRYNIPILICHDFDDYGMAIASTLVDDGPRYQFGHPITVHDIGLRLEDVERYSLQEERAANRKIKPSVLAGYGATQDEIEFLGTHRVELNAFTSDQFIEWLESKFTEIGLGKVVPNASELEKAYHHYVRVCEMESAIREAEKRIDGKQSIRPAPASMADDLSRALAQRPNVPWDLVLYEMVRDEMCAKDRD